MKLSGNTVLITGGASGIGFALAQRFKNGGSDVIICGRRKEKLEEAQKHCKGIHTLQVDVSNENERKRLFEKVTSEFPNLNVLINNAGIQNRPPSMKEPQDWSKYHQEIATNLEAPMHLSMLFITHLLKQKSPAIINVSSGLAFMPIAFMATYCATKAAIHSFTMSLRAQLTGTPIQVIEVIPPAVNTDLGGPGLHATDMPLDKFTNQAIQHLERGDLEFGVGFSEKARNASREELNEIFKRMNRL